MDDIFHVQCNFSNKKMQMKKLALVLIFLLSVYTSHTQVIANFEDGKTGPLTLHVMGCGVWDSVLIHPVSETFQVVDNPLCSGLNTSRKVLLFHRRGSDQGGMPWGGFWATVDPQIDLSVNKYIHVKVLKTRITPLRCKLEGPYGSLEQKNLYTQTTTSNWEDIVFNFDTLGLIGSYPVIALMPDYEEPQLQTDLLQIYIDDIILSNDPNPIRTNIICDFEGGTTGPLNLHVMGCGDWDDVKLHPVSETFSIVDNPSKTGVNQSKKVLKFNRRGSDQGGKPWGGFWSNANPNLDFTNNKYIHCKVLKPKISRMRSRIEGGPGGPLEQINMFPQENQDAWEDIVFKFDTLNIAGLYSIFSLMPDYDEQLPSGLVEMYLDDIILNNDTTRIRPAAVTFNVNMTAYRAIGKFNPQSDFVDIAGNFNGWNGDNFHLTSTNDSIYSITIPNFSINATIEFKFRINGSWAAETCEFPDGRPNRKYTIPEPSNIYNAWYNDQVLGFKELEGMGIIDIFPNPVQTLLKVKSTTLLKEVILLNLINEPVLSINNPSSKEFAMDFSGISDGIYFILFRDLKGKEYVRKLVKR